MGSPRSSIGTLRLCLSRGTVLDDTRPGAGGDGR